MNNSNHEFYRYTHEGSRVVKCARQQSRASEGQRQVHYLTGLEIRTTRHADREIENVRVISVTGVRIHDWLRGKPEDVARHQLRFCIKDRADSSTLELDSQGKIISREQYYPFGGTALWATRQQSETRFKTLRYSGKERDMTGLLYYGYRYYAPWLLRWLNTDPAGNIDGLNRFRMVQNNPVTLSDPCGLAPERKRRLSLPAGFAASSPAKISRTESPRQAERVVNKLDQLKQVMNPFLSGPPESGMESGVFQSISEALNNRLVQIQALQHNQENPVHNHLIQVLSIYEKPLAKYLDTADLQRLSQVSRSLKLTIDPLQPNLAPYGEVLFGTAAGGGKIPMNIDLVRDLPTEVSILDKVHNDGNTDHFDASKKEFYAMVHILQKAVMGKTEFFPRQLTSIYHTAHPINPQALQLTGFPLDDISSMFEALQEMVEPSLKDQVAREWYGKVIELDKVYKQYIKTHYK
ncbi:RHS repeat domain-containing protein [Pantoea sp. At-9b]|uniref:RHS repeat domain-containing protein n=1 Tax=Pantoea sp. (strain At-9b) TaxID=592316 RepID=UPI0001B3EB4F|nr:RHS repeat-associated core domain-containing protein [Pantoea sp. At-9b]